MKDTTKSLVQAITMDIWPSIAARIDFGIDSQEIYEAYYKKIRSNKAIITKLDAACCNGPKLTKLMGITITTAWDELPFNEDDISPFKDKHCNYLGENMCAGIINKDGICTRCGCEYKP